MATRRAEHIEMTSKEKAVHPANRKKPMKCQCGKGLGFNNVLCGRCEKLKGIK